MHSPIKVKVHGVRLPVIKGPIVKICGLTCAEDVHCVVNAGLQTGMRVQAGFLYGVTGGCPADFKKRENGLAALKKLVAMARGQGIAVAIVTDLKSFRDIEEMLHFVAAKHLTLQLSNDCSRRLPGRLESSFSHSGLIIVKGIRVDDKNSDTECVEKWDNMRAISALLFDSSAGNRNGGTGAAHDWNVSAGCGAQLNKPFMLAGGLHDRNVGEAIATVQPYGVDCDTGTRKELPPGTRLTFDNYRRDPQKCIAFVHEAKAAFDRHCRRHWDQKAGAGLENRAENKALKL